MYSDLIGTLVTINNFLHDLASAFLFSSLLLAWMFDKRGELSPSMLRSLHKWALVSLAWVIIGGVIRLVTYQQYYLWVADGGTRQIPLLLFKHFLILILVASGIYFLFQLNKNKGKRQ